MRKHQRQVIREAVVARLLGATAAEDRVKKTRVVPWKGLQLPALAVYSLEESVDPQSVSTAPRELTRTLQLAIEGAVSYAERADDALDDLCVEIERAMDSDVFFIDDQGVAQAADSILSSTTLGIDPKGDMDVGYLRLVYDVTYRTPVPNPDDQPLNDLKTADIKIDVGDPALPDADKAEDTLVNLDQQGS